jgi:hypothetical protein
VLGQGKHGQARLRLISYKVSVAVRSAKTVKDLEEALVAAKPIVGPSDPDLATFEECLRAWSEPFQVKLVNLNMHYENVWVRRSDTVGSLCVTAGSCFGELDRHTMLTSAGGTLEPYDACLDAVGITDDGTEISVTFGNIKNPEKAGTGQEDPGSQDAGGLRETQDDPLDSG